MCFAHAVLRKSKILVMDEATASVDFNTDMMIQNTIRKEFANVTVLTIAHRINTIIDSDRVLVMDDGKIAEFDSPHQLMQDKNSIFYSLANEAGILNATTTYSEKDAEVLTEYKQKIDEEVLPQKKKIYFRNIPSMWDSTFLLSNHMTKYKSIRYVHMCLLVYHCKRSQQV